jgi:hypothetical protein
LRDHGWGDDGLGGVGFGGKFGGGSQLEATAADIDLGGTRTEADDGGNLDELRAEAFGGLDAPAATDEGSRLGLLRDDASGGNDGRVEMIAAGQLQAALEGGVLGLGRSHAAQVRHGNLPAMDGESHADQSRGERDDDEYKNLGEQTEKANHPKIRVDGCGSGDKCGGSRRGVFRSGAGRRTESSQVDVIAVTPQWLRG